MKARETFSKLFILQNVSIMFSFGSVIVSSCGFAIDVFSLSLIEYTHTSARAEERVVVVLAVGNPQVKWGD